jgi:aminoglycoside 6-adenylyltransferase
MRPEQEILRLVMEYANRDDGIRLVLMNGSRVNPNARKDPLQDFDIACLVAEVGPYRKRTDIVAAFGELLILQTPEDMGDPSQQDSGFYSYLMQFMDGNRIDLSFHSMDRLEALLQDSLTVVLLDKDGRVGTPAPPTDLGYLPEPPTEKQFQECCNEFWWVNPYVAKGLWRNELTYARYMLDVVIRDQLMKMLTWYFGVRTGFKKSPGKMGKYLRSGLEAELWSELEKTYADAHFENIWSALFAMGRLFRRSARVVAAHYGFSYPQKEDANVSAYLLRIKELPPDAQEI